MSTEQMKSGNKLLRKLNEGQGPSFGAWQALPNPQISRIFAESGYDWVVVDCEHGDFADKDMREIVRVLADNNVSPVVRIPDLQGWMIKRAYDGGAHGILVPLIQSAAECRKVVSWSKYPPVGERGSGPFLTHQSFGLSGIPGKTEYMTKANESLLVLVQIETKNAVDQIEDICKVEGLDGVLIGPYDLGLNIGHPIQGREKPLQLVEVINSIVKAVKASGKKVGIFCDDGHAAKQATAQGFDFICAAVDISILVGGAESNLAVAKGG